MGGVGDHAIHLWDRNFDCRSFLSGRWIRTCRRKYNWRSGHIFYWNCGVKREEKMIVYEIAEVYTKPLHTPSIHIKIE